MLSIENFTKSLDNGFMAKEIEPLGKLIGKNVKRIRKDVLGFSQEELAERYGCDHSYIAQIELGLKVPGTKTRKKLAAALKCEPNDLLEHIDGIKCAEEDRSLFFPSAVIDTALIGRIVELTEEYFNHTRLKISPTRKGNLISKLYEYAVTERRLPDDLIIKAYLRMV